MLREQNKKNKVSTSLFPFLCFKLFVGSFSAFEINYMTTNVTFKFVFSTKLVSIKKSSPFNTLSQSCSTRHKFDYIS